MADTMCVAAHLAHTSAETKKVDAILPAVVEESSEMVGQTRNTTFVEAVVAERRCLQMGFRQLRNLVFELRLEDLAK